MKNPDEEFIEIFNNYYPFVKYILKVPKSLGFIYDDCVLTELFIPYFEAKPVLDRNGDLSYFTKRNYEELYCKIQGPAGEMRIAYLDFGEHIQETIRFMVIQDLGPENWQSLYVEYDENDYSKELESELRLQKKLIQDKYGSVDIKDNINTKYINGRN